MAKLAIFFAAFGLTGVVAKPAVPTFYRNVLPILQAHCQSCHRAGEVAPMALMDYRGVRPWASAIRQATRLRQMPPWFAANGRSQTARPSAPPVSAGDDRQFANDRSLPEADIRTISDWVEAGAPEGDRRDAPAPPHWVEGWTIGQPEIILQMPTAFQIPIAGILPYEYVIVPTHFEHDTWVRLAEVRAGDRVHTHHIVVSVREPGSGWLAGEPVGTPFVLGPGSAGGSIPGEFLAGYGPGALPETLAPGDAKLIKAGSDLVFQLHYTPNGTPGADRSRIGMVLAHQAPKRRVLMAAAANIRFRIPAGDENYRVDASLTLQHDATLISLLPHMHLRGKSFEFRIRYPDGREQTLLDVPHYSYNWQLSYYLARPLELPAGTVIECTAYFDNSANNPLNPDPSKTVRFGPQSTDEMMIGYFEVAVDLSVDLRELLLKGPTS